MLAHSCIHCCRKAGARKRAGCSGGQRKLGGGVAIGVAETGKSVSATLRSCIWLHTSHHCVVNGRLQDQVYAKYARERGIVKSNVLEARQLGGQILKSERGTSLSLMTRR